MTDRFDQNPPELRRPYTIFGDFSSTRSMDYFLSTGLPLPCLAFIFLVGYGNMDCDSPTRASTEGFSSFWCVRELVAWGHGLPAGVIYP